MTGSLIGRTAMAAVLMVAGLAVAPALAQQYPTKTIRVISPFDPGGASDLSTRLIADLAKDMLKVAIVVENRPGAGGTVGIGQVLKSPADGYTLFQFTSTPVMVRPLVASVPYDPLKDITYLGRYMVGHSPLVVRSDSRFHSVDDLLKYAQENPGRLRWAAGAVQGAAHLSTDAIFRHAKVRTTFVPTGGGPEAIMQVIGGQIEAASVVDFAGPAAEGKVRLLAESGPVRIGVAPAVPTYKELGYPLALAVYMGWGGPAGLPADVIKTWDEVMSKAVQHPRFQEFLKAQNASLYYANSAELTREIAAETASVKETLQSLGMGRAQ